MQQYLNGGILSEIDARKVKKEIREIVPIDSLRDHDIRTQLLKVVSLGLDVFL